jgi:regulator of sirC expression with transglutaminase-like and TPR domain
MKRQEEDLIALSVRTPPPTLDRVAAGVAAVEQMGVDPDAIVASIDALAEGAYVSSDASVFEAVARLNHHLFDKHGFAGDDDTYDDVQNSLIDRVILRRKGLPITLGLLYVEVARRLGVLVHPIGFPGHFLVSPATADETPRFFVDVFRKGSILREDRLLHRLRELGAPGSTERYLAPVGPRDVLVRMTHNLKSSYMHAGDYRNALRQVDRLLLLQPELSDLHRTRGLLLDELGERDEAAAALETFLEVDPDADEGGEVRKLLKLLRN